eukprot:Phypoly_transcript_08992.p1 GENE.Phypoly_transcript_08992~~Phypoly_transcript_08992.p1  ORF type:complete len:319 (+),score=27.71 Phypoly_transcript_08992:157-1113(+)
MDDNRNPFLHPPFVPSSMQDMSWFTPSYMYLIIFFYFVCEITRKVLHILIPEYKTFTRRSQRNMETYVLEIIVTSVTFVMAVGWGLQLVLHHNALQNILITRASGSIICALYIFEICYRLDMNIQLFAHHMLTIVLCILAIQSSIDTTDVRFLAAGIVLVFSANTEQLSFVGLFLYRLKHKYAKITLRIAAVQTLAFKAISIAGMYVIMIKACYIEDTAHLPHRIWIKVWGVLIWIIVPGLVVTQIYGAIIMWKISSKVQVDPNTPARTRGSSQAPFLQKPENAVRYPFFFFFFSFPFTLSPSSFPSFFRFYPPLSLF